MAKFETKLVSMTKVGKTWTDHGEISQSSSNFGNFNLALQLRRIPHSARSRFAERA
jgi:hypothetical protein